MEGDCYLLASKYLQSRNLAYIISDGIRGKYCTWNFRGNTQADFNSWCKREGLYCGGNPFYVGYDSVWYQGQYMPHQKAIYLKSIDDRENARKRLQDSLSSVRDTLPLRRVTIEYLEIGKSTAERLGFDYSDYIGRASFSNLWEDLFSVTIQAKASGDTSWTYRTYTTMYDSTLHVFWGGSRDKIKSSNVTSNGVISNNYETESYGLTFDIKGLTYSYTHSSDYEHSISGNGKLTDGRNSIFGAYQQTYYLEKGVPFLMHIPFVGLLFRHQSETNETRYVFIDVIIGRQDDADGL